MEKPIIEINKVNDTSKNYPQFLTKIIFISEDPKIENKLKKEDRDKLINDAIDWFTTLPKTEKCHLFLEIIDKVETWHLQTSILFEFLRRLRNLDEDLD